MMKKYPYRQGANAVVVDSDGMFLIVQKTIYDDHQWDFAGGAAEEGETLEQCILRELQEELGSNSFNTK